MTSVKKPPDKLWFPTLLHSANNIDTNSWFNILQSKNPVYTTPVIQNINNTFIKTMKFPIYPNKKQQKILHNWFHSVIDMYNITNKYILDYYNKHNEIETFITLRKKLLNKAKEIVNKTKINKHILDYSIKHCLEMYKSALTNLRKKNIKDFNIKDLNKNRNRFNLVLEPANFSKRKNGFCITELGEMKSQRSLIGLFNRNSILQYNKNSNKYYIISPFEKHLNKNIRREEECGIDLGVRTFATVYSPLQSLEIGTNLIPTIDKYNKKMDKIKSDRDLKILSQEKYNKLLYKYGSKMRNKIDDLHKKVSVYLVKKFDIVNLGKISTSKIISNKRDNLQDIVKRRISVLSFYKFNETIKIMANKYNSRLNEINEYMTSKTCHSCKNIHNNLGGNKIYKCEKCGIELDRDLNASINIYKKGFCDTN